MESKRENWLDSLKGFAIICVVIGHVIDGAWKIYPENLWSMQVVYNFIYSFHMPLFFFLSGCAFSIAFNKPNVEKISM